MQLPPHLKGQRLDHAVAALLTESGVSVSVREVRRALKAGQIRINGQTRAPGDPSQGSEAVDLSSFVARAEATLHQPSPEPTPLAEARVLFEDAGLLVLDKPSGWHCQPHTPYETGTLLHAAVALAPEVARAGPPLEGGLVHRLDQGTSGVVIFAKTLAQRQALRQAFGRHEVNKTYLALAQGVLRDREVVDAPLGPGPGRSRVRVYDAEEAGGQPARTELVVKQRLQHNLLWVEAHTCFGRRHQVRVHLQTAGAPIVGDDLYGDGPQPWLTRLALHASQVKLPDGRSFVAPVPEALSAALAWAGARPEVSP